jgi:pilus assembly protein CpaF
MTPEMLELMQGLVKARLNLLITGGTGSGKTTLLNCLSESIPHDERVVTIEDSAELQLRQPHVVRLETRPANIEGVGEVAQRKLVINSLRMRPDRIIVGEVRGAETIDMLQAMNTGHDGSITTLHANTPRDALHRLETMVSMASLNLPEKGVRAQIASAHSRRAGRFCSTCGRSACRAEPSAGRTRSVSEDPRSSCGSRWRSAES